MSKKLFRSLISLVLTAVFLTAILAVSAEASVLGGTQTGRAYFWKYSTGSAYYYTIPDGTYFTVAGGTYNGRTYVYCNGTYGWITSSLVKPDNYYGGYSSTVYMYNRAADYSTLRKGPSTSAAAILRIPYNGACEVFNYTSGFYYVRYNGYYGYVRADLLSSYSYPDPYYGN